MSGDGTNFIACAFGMKRSGKSHALGIMARLFPRRILFDFIGEFSGKIDGARYAHSLGEAVDTLQAERKRGNKWSVVCVMSPADAIELCSVLAPIGKKPETSFSYAAGGIAIECGEIQLIAPNNQSIPAPMANVIAMGRHYRLSLLGAARRPREVNRLLTSQADALLAFRQHEPRDCDFLGDVMRSDVPFYLRKLPARSFLRYLPNFGTLEIVDANGAATLIPSPHDAETD